jgi:hypothetical protein
MKWRLALTAIFSSGVTLMAVNQVKFQNAKLTVRELIYEPGVPRERYTRPTDQLIVFLDDCRYERTDSVTREKTIRERKSGEVLWHDKGEDAPVLKNLGQKAYRTLVIELP